MKACLVSQSHKTVSSIYGSSYKKILVTKITLTNTNGNLLYKTSNCFGWNWKSHRITAAAWDDSKMESY